MGTFMPMNQRTKVFDNHKTCNTNFAIHRLSLRQDGDRIIKISEILRVSIDLGDNIFLGHSMRC